MNRWALASLSGALLLLFCLPLYAQKQESKVFQHKKKGDEAAQGADAGKIKIEETIEQIDRLIQGGGIPEERKEELRKEKAQMERFIKTINGDAQEPSAAGVEYRRPHGYDNERRETASKPEAMEKWKPRDLRMRESTAKGLPLTTPKDFKKIPMIADTKLKTGEPDWDGTADADGARSAPPGRVPAFVKSGASPPLLKARKLLRGNRLQEAESEARAAVYDEPQNAQAQLVLTQTLLEQQRSAEALQNATEAKQLAPDNPDIYFLRALAHEQLGNADKKTADLQSAARLDPKRFNRAMMDGMAGKRLFVPGEGISWRLLDYNFAVEEKRNGGKGNNILLIILGTLLGFILTAVVVSMRGGRAGRNGSGLADFGTVTARLRSWTERIGPSQSVETTVTRTAGTVTSAARTPVPALKLRRNMVLSDKYILERFLGYDGMLEIWKAQDRTLGRPALIKRLYAGRKGSGTEERSRRLGEARSAAKLHHPNILELYEILDISPGLFIVYEYAGGKSVYQILEELGELPVGQTRDILIPVCRALDHAHNRGIAHGGLSPERILVTKKGYIKVADFVLARTTGEGAERYAAPEAKRGDPTPTSDIYSLGLCCYEMLTGELPNVGTREPAPRVTAILEQSLDLDHRTRTSTAKDFMKMLTDLPDSFEDVPQDPFDHSGSDTDNETEAAA